MLGCPDKIASTRPTPSLCPGPYLTKARLARMVLGYRVPQCHLPGQPGRTSGLTAPEIPLYPRTGPNPALPGSYRSSESLDSNLNRKTPPGRQAIAFVAAIMAGSARPIHVRSAISLKGRPGSPTENPANRTRLFKAAAETLPGCGRSGPAGAGGPGAWPPSGLPCGHRRTGVVSLCHR